MQILFLQGQKDTLEEEIRTHSSLWTGKSHGGYSSWGPKESDTTEHVCVHESRQDTKWMQRDDCVLNLQNC